MYFMWVPLNGAAAPAAFGDQPLVLCVSGSATTLRESLHVLPVSALAAAWSISDAELIRRPGPERLGALVTLRALILDEVERRFPRRYRAWLHWGGPHGIRSYGDLVILV